MVTQKLNKFLSEFCRNERLIMRANFHGMISNPLVTAAVLAAAALTTAGAAQAVIIYPTYVAADSSNVNTYTTLDFDPANLTNNVLLSAPINTGATLAQAQAAIFTGSDDYTSSPAYWETITVGDSSGGVPLSYFASHPAPTLVFDLGSIQSINDIILWNGYATKSNQDQGFTLSYSDNGVTFTGTYSNNLAASFTDSVEDAQTFGLGGVQAQYVAITLTSNYYSDPANPDLPGGDRVGLGKIRFDASPVPEPTTWAMTLLGFGVLGATMRSRRTRPATGA